MDPQSMSLAAAAASVATGAAQEVGKNLVERLQRRFSSGSDSNIRARHDGRGSALRDHLAYLRSWTDELPTIGPHANRLLTDSYVPLRIHHRGAGRACIDAHRQLAAAEVLQHRGHLVILGEPGAGKTTFLKSVARMAVDEYDKPGSSSLPLLVRFTELDADVSLADAVLGLMDVTLTVPEGTSNEQRATVGLRELAATLDDLNAVVILDGFDEAHPEAKRRLARDVDRLMHQSRDARIILTCRSGEQPPTRAACMANLPPLGDLEVREFVATWVGHDRASTFLDALRDTAYGAAEIRPLTLGYLCTVYLDEGRIPQKPSVLHRKLLKIYLKEWDKANWRERHSAYASFGSARKEAFLEALAFYVREHLGRHGFSENDYVRFFGKSHATFLLPEEDGDEVLAEVQAHTGLVVRVQSDWYEFAHRSVQEYLCGAYLARRDFASVEAGQLARMPDEVAVAVCLSTEPPEALVAAVSRILDAAPRTCSQFALPFIRRLRLEMFNCQPNIRVGAALLAVYGASFVDYANRDQLVLVFDPADPAVVELLRRSGVHESVSTALRQSRLSEGTDGMINVRLPLEVVRGAHLPVQDVSVPRSVFEVLGWPTISEL